MSCTKAGRRPIWYLGQNLLALVLHHIIWLLVCKFSGRVIHFLQYVLKNF